MNVLWILLTSAAVLLAGAPRDHPSSASFAPAEAATTASQNTTQAAPTVTATTERIIVAWRETTTFAVDVTNPDPDPQEIEMRAQGSGRASVSSGGDIDVRNPLGISANATQHDGPFAPGETWRATGTLRGQLPGEHWLLVTAVGSSHPAQATIAVCVHDALLHPCPAEA